MKKYLFILVVGALLASCEPDYTELLLPGDPFIAFSSTSTSVSEGNATANSVNLTLLRGTGDASAPLTVTFSATGKFKDIAGTDASNTFTILGEGGTATTVVIPAGKGSANVTLTTKQNTVSEKDKDITITLVSTSAGNLAFGFPGPSSNGKSIVVTIKDDDCPFDINRFTGDYSCLEPGYNTYNVKFTETGTNEITNNNFWDFGASIKYLLNPLTNIVTIPSQSFAGFGTNGVTGSGVMETCTGRMIVNYTVTGTNGETNVHTFTRR